MKLDHETLSVITDSEQEARDSYELETIATNDDLRSKWARYHLIGDVLRDNLTDVAPTHIVDGVRAEIQKESSTLTPQHRRRSWLRPITGLAVAASITSLAVIGVKYSDADSALKDATISGAPANQIVKVLEEPATKSQANISSVLGSPRTKRRLNGYLVKFNEQRSSFGVPGVNPYVRIVGFESQ
tara:strand:- start:1349 stop:1906 length:558 start_codon:yes stop_codon:yes gene_type:complete